MKSARVPPKSRDDGGKLLAALWSVFSTTSSQSWQVMPSTRRTTVFEWAVSMDWSKQN